MRDDPGGCLTVIMLALIAWGIVILVGEFVYWLVLHA